MSQGNNFGIGLVSPIDTDNTVENNEILGNTNGVVIAAGVKGNTVTGNVIIGNPAVQVSVDHASNPGYDIKNMGDAGANQVDGNLCVTSLNAPCPTVPPSANRGNANQGKSLAPEERK